MLPPALETIRATQRIRSSGDRIEIARDRRMLDPWHVVILRLGIEKSDFMQKRTFVRAASIKALHSLYIAHFGQPDTSIAIEHTRLRPEPMDCWIDFAAGRPGHCNFETWNP